MNTVFPILIILILGGCSSLLIQRWISNMWLGIVAAAGIATLLWVGAVYVLLWLTAPGELGPPLFAPVLYAFLTALTSAAPVMWMIAKKERHANNCVQRPDAADA